MAWLILIGVAGAVLLTWWLTVQMGFAGTLIGFVVVPVVLIVMVAVGQRRDRRRQRGVHDPASHFDANKPNWSGDATEWPIPTVYTDGASGGGTPPGIDVDERPVSR